MLVPVDELCVLLVLVVVELERVEGTGAGVGTAGVELDAEDGLGVDDVGAGPGAATPGLDEEDCETVGTGELEGVDCEAEAEAIGNACK